MVIASFLNIQDTRTPWTSPETPVAEVARVMAATGIGSIPVIDRDGRLIGMVVEGDLLRIAADRRNGIRGMAVEEVMTRDVFTVPAEAPVETALNAMEKARFRHMPVCDGQGRLLGLVGLIDLLRIAISGQQPAAAAA